MVTKYSSESPSIFAYLFLRALGATPFTGGPVAGTDQKIYRIVTGQSSVFAWAVGDDWYLVDTGIRSDAREIIEFLARQGARPDAVRAIFITHAHYDHVGGWRQFPQAIAYIGHPDREVVPGGRPDGCIPHLMKLGDVVPNPDNVRILQGFERFQLGDRVDVRVIRLQGHTRGSMAFEIRLHGVNVVAVGDAVVFGPRRYLFGASGYPRLLSRAFTHDPRDAAASLARLGEAVSSDVAIVLPSHSVQGTIQAIRQRFA